jgi:hypothetical protein
MKQSYLYLLLITCCLFTFQYSKSINNTEILHVTNALPEREVKVYIGISNGWHSTDSTQNYSKWDYVRRNATGLYTNFIEMWKCFYQNKVNTQTSCNDMRKAFVKGGCFFETSMETKLNTGVNGFNNDSSDRRSLDFLTRANFDVQYTSLNYGISADRVSLLRTYKGNRKCFYLAAPWRYGGDIFSDKAAANATVRADILTTDGFETDGPLGYWSNNQAGMREGSYSLVKYANYFNVESSIMLAPYDAGIVGYSSLTDFLTVSKQCVLGHEDNNAAPDIWTIWTYGNDVALPNFPESIVNADGEVEAANTKMGVAYWLLKHLNNFPKVDVKANSLVGNGANLKIINDSVSEIEMSKDGQCTLPIVISNDNQPQIEISPLLSAIIDNNGVDWNINFLLSGKIVTLNMLVRGGINCINDLRLSKGVKLDLALQISPKSTVLNPNPVVVNLQCMSNVSNTKNKKTAYKVTVKLKSATAINDLKSSQFSVFPNPSNGIVTIQSNNNTFNLDIYNTSGNQVYSVRNANTGTSISSKELGGKGAYFFKVNNEVKKVFIL